VPGSQYFTLLDNSKNSRKMQFCELVLKLKRNTDVAHAYVYSFVPNYICPFFHSNHICIEYLPSTNVYFFIFLMQYLILSYIMCCSSASIYVNVSSS
jgi:hypothetical protein